MTAGGEFDDDRDDCVDCRCGECEDMRREAEEWRRPFGPGYVGALEACADAVVSEDALDRAVPLGGRWPEPRVVDQDRAVWLRDGTAVPLAGLSPADAARLLAHVRSLAVPLHEAAARDERLTTSTALRWAMEQAGVPGIGDLDPLAWLESSVLVRALQSLTEPEGR